jgi:hypothetical protein
MGELMDRSNRVFGSLTKFDEAFPDLEDAIVEWEETGAGLDEWSRGPHTVSLRHRGGLLRCSNPLCRRGGFEVDLEVSLLRMKHETEKAGELWRPGDEGSPKGRRMGRRCLNRIKYKLTLKYREGVPRGAAPLLSNAIENGPR